MRRLITRPLTAFLSLCLLAAAPTAALAKRAAPVTETRADIRARRSEQARALVEKHFQALAAGDAKAVRALWTRDARVTSFDAAGTSKRQTLSTALARWVAHHEGMSWEIKGVTPLTATELVVVARVTWNGATFDDTLRVVRQGNTMRIRHKESRPHIADAARVRSPY